MFFQQRLQLDLHESRDVERVPWCCVVSDNSKVQFEIYVFEDQILIYVFLVEFADKFFEQEDAMRQLNGVMASFRRYD